MSHFLPVGSTERSPEARPFPKTRVDANQPGVVSIRNAEGVLLFEQGQTVGDVEGTLVGCQEFPARIVFKDPLVAVAVCHKENARRGHGHVRRLAEMRLIRSRDEGLAQRQARRPASFGELMISNDDVIRRGCSEGMKWCQREEENLKDLMKGHVSDPDIALCINLQAVRHVEQIRAPVIHQVSRSSVQSHDRIVLDGSILDFEITPGCIEGAKAQKTTTTRRRILLCFSKGQ